MAESNTFQFFLEQMREKLSSFASDLHKAASDGDIALIKQYVESNQDVNLMDDYNRTPLYQATQNGHSHAAKALLELGALVNNSCENPLLVVRDAEFAKLLIEAGGDVNCRNLEGNSPLVAAVNIENRDLCCYLLSVGADMDLEDGQGRTALHNASTHSDPALVETLIEHGADVNRKDSFGKTPLHHACEKNHRGTMSVLISKGAMMTEKDIEGNCPIHYCIHSSLATNSEQEDENLISVLNEMLNTDVNSNQQTATGQTILHLAATYAKGSVVELLIDKGSDVRARDGLGKTPLHCAALNQNCVSVAEILINKGGDLNARDAWGQSVLHVAVQNKKVRYVEVLIKRGADVNVTDFCGVSPLHTAAVRRSRLIGQLLISHGANVNATDYCCATPLHFAAWNDNSDVLELLLENGADTRHKDILGETALETAVFKQSEFAICQLAKKTKTNAAVVKLSTYSQEELDSTKFDEILETDGDVKRSELDCEKYLMDVLSTPSVGRGCDDEEAREIQRVVGSLAESIVDKLPNEDSKLRCTLLYAGSTSEGTKTKLPDEFDFTICLEELSDHCYFVPEEEDQLNALTITSSPAIPLVEGSTTLSERLQGSEAVMEQTFISNYVRMLLQDDDESKQFCKYTGDNSATVSCAWTNYIFGQLIKKISFKDDFPKDARLIVNEVTLDPAISMEWRGCRYKSLQIHVDVVPALRLRKLPDNLSRQVKIVTPEVRALPILVVSKMTSGGDVDLWRCSTSLQETAIFRLCQPRVRNSYIVAKALLGSAVCPLVSFGEYEDVKMLYAMQHEEGPLHDLQDLAFYESVEEIFPSYVLKMAFLFAIEDKASKEGLGTVFGYEDTECKTTEVEQKPRYGPAEVMNTATKNLAVDVALVRDIFDRCEAWLSGEFVPSFFNPRQNVLGSRMLEGDSDKALSFVRYIQKLLI